MPTTPPEAFVITDRSAVAARATLGLDRGRPVVLRDTAERLDGPDRRSGWNTARVGRIPVPPG